MSLTEAKDSSQRGDEEQVDPEELHVREVGEYLVEDDDGDELSDGVGGHVLEYPEGRDEGTAALSDQSRHAGNVRSLRGEGRGH